MPPKKKDKKSKPKTIPKRLTKPRDIVDTPTFREITTGLAGLRGMLMNRNIPNMSPFPTFIPNTQAAQEIALVRAQANNTIQRIENETNKIRAEKQISKLADIKIPLEDITGQNIRPTFTRRFPAPPITPEIISRGLKQQSTQAPETYFQAMEEARPTHKTIRQKRATLEELLRTGFPEGSIEV